MSRKLTLPALLCAALVFGVYFHSAQAAPSTSKGNISVTQATAMIEKAPKDEQARQLAMAYLFGVGETVGFHLSQENGVPQALSCRSPFSLDTSAVERALRTGAPDQSKWSETLATPIIVRDLLTRAGCL
jgi:hypothetical protein